MSPERQACVLEIASGRPPLSDEEKQCRRLAIEEGKAARKAEKRLARQNKRTKNSFNDNFYILKKIYQLRFN